MNLCADKKIFEFQVSKIYFCPQQQNVVMKPTESFWHNNCSNFWVALLGYHP